MAGDEPTSDEPFGFSEFVLSLATNAIAHMGGADEEGDRLPSRVDLPVARQHIDILSMLKDKTKGNLLPNEARLLDALLYDLRMRYLEVAKTEAG